MKKICWFCFDFRVDHKTEEDSKAYEAVKGSLSTKIEAVVKTLIKIRNDDPTAKSLVFSTWSSVLDILESALQTNDIQFATLHVQGKFKRNLQKFKVWYELLVMYLAYFYIFFQKFSYLDFEAVNFWGFWGPAENWWDEKIKTI